MQPVQEQEAVEDTEAQSAAQAAGVPEEQLDVQPEEDDGVSVQVDDSDSEYEDEDDVFVSIPDLAAELDFERVEADIDNEVEVFIHMDSESAGKSSDADIVMNRET